MCEYCKICGAPLRDGNPDGIGCECREALHKAKFDQAVKDGYYLKKYIYEAEQLRKRFLAIYSNVVFRSSFRKSFYQSMQTAERISKKQLEVMQGLILEKGLDLFTKEEKEAEDRYLNTLIDSYEVTRGMIETARKYIRR